MKDLILPTLYGVTTKGDIKEWSIHVEHCADVSFVITRHGKYKGKMQTDEVRVTAGKNIGRANETMIWQQADADAQSKWTQKRDREMYTEVLPTSKTESAKLPMLAQKYKERKHKIKWPAAVQPKLNGVRCLAHIGETGVKFISRKGVEYVGLAHIEKEIMNWGWGPGTILDGELFNTELSLQEIVSRVKRVQSTHENVTDIQYHIYDMAIANSKFVNRSVMLTAGFKRFGAKDFQYVVEVPTTQVEDEEEILKIMHPKFVSEGYEGTMIRNLDGLYKFNHRSEDLQKMKDFLDDEYEIIGGTTGVGREEGCVVFQCVTPEGNTFSVRPKGTLEQRRKWFTDIDKLIGKKLTVRYLEMSADSIPQHPTGLEVRDYE